MSLIKSFFYSLKEAKFNPVTIFHSALYAATVSYLRVLKHLVAVGPKALRDWTSVTYHGKVLRLAEAEKIISVNRDIELRNQEQVVPYKHARDIILKNPQNLVVYQCPCRAQKSDPCRPTDVCLIVGDPFADLVRMFQPFRSRRITAADALRILREEDERGHIHTAWFKKTMLDRFYAICNCCSCCCLGMKFMVEHSMKMIMPSGYRAAIGEECLGCGSCLRFCQFGAMKIVSPSSSAGEKICRIDSVKCFGCGVCETKCPVKAISLVRDPSKGVPLDIESLAPVENQLGPPDVGTWGAK